MESRLSLAETTRNALEPQVISNHTDDEKKPPSWPDHTGVMVIITGSLWAPVLPINLPDTSTTS